MSKPSTVERWHQTRRQAKGILRMAGGHLNQKDLVDMGAGGAVGAEVAGAAMEPDLNGGGQIRGSQERLDKCGDKVDHAPAGSVDRR